MLRSLSIKIQKCNFSGFPSSFTPFVEENVNLMKPSDVVICNGSDKEFETIVNECIKMGNTKPLKMRENCFITRTDPSDVARVESKTFIVTKEKQQATTIPKDGSPSILGNWMSDKQFESESKSRFDGCMKGRKMYVIPFSMGPTGSAISRTAVQLTDSPYVVASMRIMTRVGTPIAEDFVKCVHSVGQPLPMQNPPIANWPCDPSKVLVAHLPDSRKIMSYGSGYGGNSLLGKKCLALRLGSVIARNEGWFAEHMLILGITNPEGRKKFVAAAFPSACGKTNLAMLQSTLPGYKVECVGDDIAWMRFDSNGKLRAINPERGFFGVAPGTSNSTNPCAMQAIKTNTIFTNVAETSDGDVFWEGLESEVDLKSVKITDWCNKPWIKGAKVPAAHPNSRFCVPAEQCPNISPDWESPDGVHIEAILFGGRRPKGVPLVFQAKSWPHGVLIGAGMRSEATSAAEYKGRAIMHDPFAMRPFFGYNFGQYLAHWLRFEEQRNLQLPQIFHVNWFRRDADGKFLWPGFGDNIRVLDWIFRRLDGDKSIFSETPIGFVPLPGSLNTSGLRNSDLNLTELLSVPREFWRDEMTQIKSFLTNQVDIDLPEKLLIELNSILRQL